MKTQLILTVNGIEMTLDQARQLWETLSLLFSKEKLNSFEDLSLPNCPFPYKITCNLE